MRRGALGVCAAAVAIGTLLRLHFIDVPLVVDEGGYAAIARLWGEGFRLYGDVAWVDRPQGLMVLFRLAGLADDPAAFRVLAIAAAAITTASVGAFAWALAGARAAALGALLYAIVSPAPHLEGFTANGELLAGAFAAAACAAAAWWLRTRHPGLLIAAGLAAGAAPLVKQSAIDGVAVLVAALVLAGRPRLRPALLALASVATLPAVALVHGAVTGLGDWWWAIAGYRSTTESVVSGDVHARAQLLADSIPPALEDLAPLLLLAIAGAVAARRARCLAMPATWLAVGFAGFLGGGLYHPHYWVQLVPPLAVFAGLGADVLASRLRLLVAVLAIGFGVTVATSAEVYATGDPVRVSELTSKDSRLPSAAAVGRALAANSGPGQPVYVIWANAGVYWYADRPPSLRYLWYLNVARIPGAAEEIRATFAGEHPPQAVALYQDPDELDPTGTIARVLATRYRQLPPVDGIPVYVLAS